MSDGAYESSITTPAGTYFFPFDDHSWSIEMGYTPRIQKWRVPQEIAAAVMTDLLGTTGTGREVTLTFGDPWDVNPAAVVPIQRVIVLGVEAADNIQRRYLCFTDVLFYFTHAWTEWDINLRRRVGDTRVLGAALVTGLTPVATVAYAPWSLNAGAAFTWDTALAQAALTLGTGQHGRPDVAFAFDTLSSSTIHAQVMQEVSTASEGTLALARAVENVPGAGVYVSRAGVVHVCDAKPGAEAAYFATITTVPHGGLWDHGSIVLADNSSLRPVPSAHSWRVYFGQEVEIRLDYNASGAEVPSGATWSTPSGNNFFLIPVIQVTDISLEIPAGTYYGGIVRSGTATERTVGQGTWLPQDQAFAAWGAKTIGSDTANPFTLPQLTDDYVASHWFNGGLELYSIGNLINAYDPVWGARIRALQKCWRSAFLANPSAWETVRHAFAVRCSVWDPSTGTRAPSPVYCNFHLWPSNNKASSQDTVFGYDVSDFADSGLLANSFPSGFLVDMVDDELGVLMIDRDLARFPGHAQVAPSPVVPGTNFTGGPGNNEAILQKLVRNVDDGALKAWRLAVILSLVPASPNSLGRLYEVQVSTTDAAATAGVSVPAIAGGSPDKETRTNYSDARIPWPPDDNLTDVTKVLACFPAGGAIDTLGPTDGARAAWAVPVNLDQELRPVAKAIAATQLMATLDHYVGTASIPVNKDLHPIGSLTRVVHRVKNRRLVSEFTCTADPPKYTVEQALQGKPREFIFKQLGAVR